MSGECDDCNEHTLGCECQDFIPIKWVTHENSKKIFNYRDQMEWISIKDRLPNHGECVGYTYDGKNIRRDVYYPGYNGSWESENNLGYSINETNISHWMPLPEPPRKYGMDY